MQVAFVWEHQLQVSLVVQGQSLNMFANTCGEHKLIYFGLLFFYANMLGL